jgi:predicted NACHT family NTPase
LSQLTRIIEVFIAVTFKVRLLILGEPGAGKTTELLTLAQDLVQQAIADESAAIPIIFELSAWKEDKSIEQWLVEQLTAVYKLPASIGKQWLDTQQLLPLLDGLDELGLVCQERCVEAINQFLVEHNQPHLVVCCRREEYEQGELQLERLKGAVYLQPLTDKQIKDYFEQLKRSHLWQVVKQTPELLALARFPLFATMIPYAYQGRVIHNNEELFKNYIAKRLAAPESQGVYPPGKAPSKGKLNTTLSG